jgi:large repetitive protein
LANFKFASDGSGGTILYDPPGSAGQGSAVPAEIMHDPAVAALDQQLALFSQHMASAFPSSALGNDSASIGATELAGAQQSQMAQPVTGHPHA